MIITIIQLYYTKIHPPRASARHHGERAVHGNAIGSVPADVLACDDGGRGAVCGTAHRNPARTGQTNYKPTDTTAPDLTRTVAKWLVCPLRNGQRTGGWPALGLGTRTMALGFNRVYGSTPAPVPACQPSHQSR